MNLMTTALGEIVFPDDWAVAIIGSGIEQKDMYPFVAEVRNGDESGYGRTVVLYPKKADETSQIDYESIRQYLLLADRYTNLFTKEIHVDKKDGQTFFKDNMNKDGFTSQEFMSAPELGIFPFPKVKFGEGNPFPCGINAGQIDPQTIKDGVCL